MFALVALGDDAHGKSIRQEIERRTGRSVSPGAVYTALDRLEARDLVISWTGETTPARGGRRRKHYRLEPAGARALHASYSRVRHMAEGLLPRLRSLAGPGGSEAGGP